MRCDLREEKRGDVQSIRRSRKATSRLEIPNDCVRRNYAPRQARCRPPPNPPIAPAPKPRAARPRGGGLEPRSPCSPRCQSLCYSAAPPFPKSKTQRPAESDLAPSTEPRELRA